MKRIVLLLLLSLMLLFSACGQRGGLYLPDETNKPSIVADVVE